MGEVLIEFDLPDVPLNMNDSDTPAGRRETHRRRDVWKEAAYFATCAAFPGVGPEGRAMPPCDVYVSIPVLGNRRRDPSNWLPTIKACVDAVRKAGVWPDDDAEWVTTHEADLRPVSKADLMKSKVYIRLVPREEH